MQAHKRKGLLMRYLILAGVMTMLCTAQSSAQSPGIAIPADQIVAMRKSSMDLQQGVMAAMKAGIAQKSDVTAFADGAEGLVASGKLIPAMFPTGTEKAGDTKAKPEVWSKSAELTKDSQNFVEAAQKLLTLAKAGDTAGFATQFGETGKTCGACHREFKVKDN